MRKQVKNPRMPLKTYHVGMNAQAAALVAQVLRENGYRANLSCRKSTPEFADILGSVTWYVETEADGRIVEGLIGLYGTQTQNTKPSGGN